MSRRARTTLAPSSRFWTAALAALALLAGAPAALAGPADRDPAFGVGGSMLHDLGVYTRFTDVARGSDGSIAAVGLSDALTGGATLSPLILARYNASGVLQGAVTRIPADQTTRNAAVAIDAAGRIYIAVDLGDGDVRVERRLANGALDPAFGRGGVAGRVSIHNGATSLVGAHLASGNRIVIGAVKEDRSNPETTLLRYTEAGAPDTTFSGDGRREIPGFSTDFFVDGTDRIVVARGGREPFDPFLDIVRVAANAATAPPIAVPTGVQQADMRVAEGPGGSILIAGTQADGITTSRVRVARLTAAGDADASFSGGNLLLSGTVDAILRELVVDPSGRAVTILGASDAIGQTFGIPRRIVLSRFAAAGGGDTTFNFGSATGRDDLALSQKVDPIGGGVAFADKLLVSGGTTSYVEGNGGGSSQAFVAQYGVEGRRPRAALTRTYRPLNAGEEPRSYARPGQPVDFDASGSTDEDGTIASYIYDLDGDGLPETPGGSTASAAFPIAGTYRAAVRVVDNDGLDDVATADIEVRNNQKPLAALYAGQNTMLPASLPGSLQEDSPIVFRATGNDLDGDVRKIEFDVDGQPGYERLGAQGTSNVSAAITTKTIYNGPTLEWGARVTDNEGGVTEERHTLTLTKPPCDADDTLSFGRLRATAGCWRPDKESSTKTRWKASDSPPPPPGGSWVLSGMTIGTANELEVNAFDFDGRAWINGMVFTDYEQLQIITETGKKTKIFAAGGTVETQSPTATRLRLTSNAFFTWTLDGNKLTNVIPTNGTYAGLKVAAMSNDEVTLPAAGQARVKFFPVMPDLFGGVTADAPVTLDIGAGATASSSQLRRQAINAARASTGVLTGRAKRLANGVDCFQASGASLPMLDFLPQAAQVKICRSGASRWLVDARVDLASFTGGMFPGLPRVNLAGEINNNAFVGATASATWNPSVPLSGPLLLSGANFELLLDQSQFLKPSCVPDTGVKTQSLESFRDAMASRGVSRTWLNENVPDFRIDYGTPTRALCGGVQFALGTPYVELVRGNINLGVADYTDGRPDAFRMLGEARVLDMVTLQTKAAMYSNGYMDMGIRGYAELLGWFSFDSRFNVAVDTVSERFNAQAYVEGCVLYIELCAGIKGVLSSRGIGACLIFRILGEEWNPGATYRWGGSLTPYFSGCDLDDVTVNFSGQGSTIITPVFVNGSRAGQGERARRQQDGGKHEQVIDLPKDLPGTYIAVKGQNGALAKFTVQGPDGSKLLVDGAAVDGKPTETPQGVLLFDKTRGISHVLLPRPKPGRWKVVPEPGSVPIVEVVSAQGLESAGLKASVAGKGRARELRYSLNPAPGQVVRFEERGPTGKQFIGRANGASGTLRFTSAAGKAERRPIIAVVEQDGMLREEIEVASYQAPATGRPAKPGRLRVRRAGSTLRIQWAKASGATTYVVKVTLSDGRALRRVTSKRSLQITKVARTSGATVRVQGVNELSDTGRTATAKLARPKRK